MAEEEAIAIAEEETIVIPKEGRPVGEPIVEGRPIEEEGSMKPGAAVGRVRRADDSRRGEEQHDQADYMSAHRKVSLTQQSESGVALSATSITHV